jgi:hypothetical protein
MKPVAIITFNKIVTTLIKQFWLGFDLLWPAVVWRVAGTRVVHPFILLPLPFTP